MQTLSTVRHFSLVFTSHSRRHCARLYHSSWNGEIRLFSFSVL